MTAERNKAVLVVDDEDAWRTILRDAFMDRNRDQNCPYEFRVDVAVSAAECAQQVRANHYDVIVLDVKMEEERSGIVAALAISEQVSREVAVKIIFTGFCPSYRECVEVMRYGVWDYIIKDDVDDIPATRVVVESALARLQQLDLIREQEHRIAREWLPVHLPQLQQQHCGQLVALWHKPDVHAIATGDDAFELEKRLKDWRKQHTAWEQPFIVQVPPTDAEGAKER
jgi:DNA-binding NtrC family response regulator